MFIGVGDLSLEKGNDGLRPFTFFAVGLFYIMCFIRPRKLKKKKKGDAWGVKIYGWLAKRGCFFLLQLASEYFLVTTSAESFMHVIHTFLRSNKMKVHLLVLMHIYGN